MQSFDIINFSEKESRFEERKIFYVCSDSNQGVGTPAERPAGPSTTP